MSWGSSAARFLASASTVLVVRWLRRHSQQRALLRVWSAKRRPVTTVDATIRLPKEDLDPDLAGCDSVAQLRERIAKLGLPPLVPREMHSCSVSLAGRARKLLGNRKAAGRHGELGVPRNLGLALRRLLQSEPSQERLADVC